MSGHSKWSQIKHKKAVTDAARSRIFSRHARLIALESKKAAGNQSAPGLVAAIARAKTINMPKDNIDRAVAKGTSKDSASLEQVLYEAYGPGGVALMIDALTDNKNRTTPEIKHILSKHGIDIAVPGAAAWAFTKTGDAYAPNEPLVEITGNDEEKLATILSTLDEHDDVQRVFTNARGYESTEEGE